MGVCFVKIVGHMTMIPLLVIMIPNPNPNTKMVMKMKMNKSMPCLMIIDIGMTIKDTYHLIEENKGGIPITKEEMITITITKTNGEIGTKGTKIPKVTTTNKVVMVTIIIIIKETMLIKGNLTKGETLIIGTIGTTIILEVLLIKMLPIRMLEVI